MIYRRYLVTVPELVTVYIPPKRPIYDDLAQLRNEAGTASNIKSDLTRTRARMP